MCVCVCVCGVFTVCIYCLCLVSAICLLHATGVRKCVALLADVYIPDATTVYSLSLMFVCSLKQQLSVYLELIQDHSNLLRTRCV